jgi:UDPglucose 6-dehydrogenase
MTRPNVAFAGLTHLGLCSAVAAASKGFTTLGFDLDQAVVAPIGEGRLPVAEPGLDALLRGNRGRIEFSADRKRLGDCDLIYVSPDIPTDDAARSDLAAIDGLLKEVVEAARDDAVIVVLSQVPPGFTRAHQRSGRLLLYQVETLVFGRAVERATRPERFIVGCADPDQPLPPALATYLAAFDCPVLPMRFESAELSKIAINCCLAASVTVANTLAETCERIGADWSEIAPALKLDRRIGAHAYLSPGLGISGGNIERDLATVIRLSWEYGTDAGAIRAFVANSAYRKDWALRTLHDALLAKVPDARLAVLGLAYKENTHSVKNSPAIALIENLAAWALRVFDPVVPADAAPHPNVTASRSPLEAVEGADAVAIMTAWPEFRDLSPNDLARAMRGRLILDPYGLIDVKAARAAGLDIRTLGVA